ncbi:MAG: hypothetical protein MUF49_31505 [Oculatellaceae cyanobacterium Prado106]|jgi:hypothetical protein|nr:hypothetical protein [Oculatellaceae cyanobacterium Prado106]
MPETIQLQLPVRLYLRLVQTAQATQRPLEEIILHALTVGSPPDWDDIPDAFQADIAALDRLDDNTLWSVARSQKPTADLERYDELLERHREQHLTDAERRELAELRQESDRFMLCKAQASALLKWRASASATMDRSLYLER